MEGGLVGYADGFIEEKGLYGEKRKETTICA